VTLRWRTAVWKVTFRQVVAGLYSPHARRWATAAPRGRRRAPAKAMTLSHSREYGGAAVDVAPPAAAAGARWRTPVNQMSHVPKGPNREPAELAMPLRKIGHKDARQILAVVWLPYRRPQNRRAYEKLKFLGAQLRRTPKAASIAKANRSKMQRIEQNAPIRTQPLRELSGFCTSTWYLSIRQSLAPIHGTELAQSRRQLGRHWHQRVLLCDACFTDFLS